MTCEMCFSEKFLIRVPFEENSTWTILANSRRNGSVLLSNIIVVYVLTVFILKTMKEKAIALSLFGQS